MLKLFKAIAEKSNNKVYFEDKNTGHKIFYDSPEECADMMTLRYLSDITTREINGCLNSTESSLKFRKRLNVIIEPQYLAWLVPTTNFPVIQDYVVNKITRLNVYMGKPTKKNPRGIRRSLRVQIEEKIKVDKGAQLSGAAPNIVHSLDAAHLTNIVTSSDFATTVIHDSFGCHIGNMEKLFKITRIEFVNLYKADPLENLLKQFKSDHKVKYGNLDVSVVENSDFAFC
jgi:DNA-directed RNA polymerase